MTEWEKREEVHCQALEEAEKILRQVIFGFDTMLARGYKVEMFKVCDQAKAWLKKYCKGD